MLVTVGKLHMSPTMCKFINTTRSLSFKLMAKIYLFILSSLPFPYLPSASSFSFIHPLPRTAMCGQWHFVFPDSIPPPLSFSLLPPSSPDLQILLTKPTRKAIQEISRILVFFFGSVLPPSLHHFP